MHPDSHHSCCKWFSGEEPPESLFMKELKKRGMTPTSLLEESNRRIYSNDEDIRYREEDGGFTNRNFVSTDVEKSLSNQRERSMALNSEGLEVNKFCIQMFILQICLLKPSDCITFQFQRFVVVLNYSHLGFLYSVKCSSYCKYIYWFLLDVDVTSFLCDSSHSPCLSLLSKFPYFHPVIVLRSYFKIVC